MTISDFESHRRENAARREAENHREAAWGRGVEKRLRIIASLQEELGRQRKEQEKTDEDQRQQESMLSRRCPLRYLPIPDTPADTRYPILDTRYSRENAARREAGWRPSLDVSSPRPRALGLESLAGALVQGAVAPLHRPRWPALRAFSIGRRGPAGLSSHRRSRRLGLASLFSPRGLRPPSRVYVG